MSSESLLRVSNQTKERVRAALNLNDDRIKQAVEGIKTWFRLQPHLPDEEDNERLESLLIRCKNSAEKVKKTLDLYYSLRSYHPEIMCGWDAREPWFDNISTYGYIFPMPEMTPELDRVVVFGYLSKQLGDDYNVNHGIKLMLMVTEIRLQEDYNLKDIIVMDMKNLSLEHIKRLTLPVIKKLENCFLRGYNARLKAFHLINAPSYADIIVAIVKSVLKSKLVSRVFVHGTDLSEFHKQVSKSTLPEEFGGDCGKVEDYWEQWKATLKKKSPWLVQRENMKSDECKRSNKENYVYEMFGSEGTFRTISID